MKDIVVNFDDLGYTVSVIPDEYCMDFKVYSIHSFDGLQLMPDGTSRTWDREWKSIANHNEGTEDLTQARIFMSGEIKWDGCSNLQFDEQEHCMLHFCGKKSATNIGQLIDRIYELAALHVENVDLELLRD